MPHHERTIATPHADIRLTDTEGAGLPVLLLHGSASSRSVFDRQFGSQLAERHRLIAIDLPGHGQSSDAPDPAAGYTITGFAAAIAALDAIGRMPGAGSSRIGDLCGVPGLRFRSVAGFPCGWFFLIAADHVDVVRLLAEAQDLPALLGDTDRQ